MAAFFASDLVVGCWALKECTMGVLEEAIQISEDLMPTALALWGVLQVLSILLNAVKRLRERALLPLKKRDLNMTQWCLYFASIVVMMYKEGYEAFQLKWAPLVVKRAFMLGSSPDYPLTIANVLLAGPYAMGMFCATRNRMIVSWSVTIGVTSLVQVVKKMPYPYRNIVDAGVVFGLSYGSIALLWTFGHTLHSGVLPNVDPCFVQFPGSDFAPGIGISEDVGGNTEL